MPEVVEKHVHVQLGGHVATWSIHDDGSWAAEYGPHSETGQHPTVDEARVASRAWVNTIHRSLGHGDLPAECGV